MRLAYNHIVGTGGIGTGMLFHSPINETLGRNESRMVELSDARDYCKLHIVFHYVARLLTPEAMVIPIGCVGDDANGRQLIREIRAAGMDVSCIREDPEFPTMISICLQYPDKDGGNFTASNSAGQQVTVSYVEQCLKNLDIGPESMVAAIPEVDMDSRVALLKAGRSRGAFGVLSVPAAEVEMARDAHIYEYVDLLAVNLEEAMSITGTTGTGQQTAEHLYAFMKPYNPDALVLMTCGKEGAYSVSDGITEHIPSMPVKVRNTTGAGDACLGGTLAGLAMGLPFRKGSNDRLFGQSPLSSAVELGTLCAGLAVECSDTIAQHVDPADIRDRMKQEGWEDRLWR